jgi:hypothetical protein
LKRLRACVCHMLWQPNGCVPWVWVCIRAMWRWPALAACDTAQPVTRAHPRGPHLGRVPRQSALLAHAPAAPPPLPPSWRQRRRLEAQPPPRRHLQQQQQQQHQQQQRVARQAQRATETHQPSRARWVRCDSAAACSMCVRPPCSHICWAPRAGARAAAHRVLGQPRCEPQRRGTGRPVQARSQPRRSMHRR